MSEIYQSFEEILSELTQIPTEKSTNTYLSRGILYACDSLVLNDNRLINNLFQNILDIDKIDTENLGHIKIIVGTNKDKNLNCYLSIDTINYNFIYTIISTNPISSSFSDYLENLLKPKNRSSKKFEF
jgi:hypothetical protein